MDLSIICHVSGKPGLYKLISRSKNSAVFESLVDGKRLPVFQLDKMSSLEEIAIYTQEKEIALCKVLRTIFQKENGAPASIDLRASEKELRAYFKEIIPDYDADRVYPSNIKKVLQWYNLLQKNNLLDEELSPREKAEAEEAEKATEKKD